MHGNALQAHAAYQVGQVHASGPVQIIVLLYEGAIRLGRRALAQFDDVAARGEALGRAHAIVSELQEALDHDQGGEISRNLDRLYTFALEGIVRANIGADRRSLEGTLSVLETLASGWREVSAGARDLSQMR